MKNREIKQEYQIQYVNQRYQPLYCSIWVRVRIVQRQNESETQIWQDNGPSPATNPRQQYRQWDETSLAVFQHLPIQPYALQSPSRCLLFRLHKLSSSKVFNPTNSKSEKGKKVTQTARRKVKYCSTLPETADYRCEDYRCGFFLCPRVAWQFQITMLFPAVKQGLILE